MSMLTGSCKSGNWVVILMALLYIGTGVGETIPKLQRVRPSRSEKFNVWGSLSPHGKLPTLSPGDLILLVEILEDSSWSL